jgi:hypothetical protein
LVHPASERDQNESEGIEDSRHGRTTLSLSDPKTF